MDALYGRAMQTTILKEYKRVRTGLWSAAPVRPRAKPPLRAPALVLNGHGFGGAVDGARRRSKSTSAFLPSNRVTSTPPTHWPRYRTGCGRPVPWQQAQRSHCPTRCVRECAQLLVQQDEAASAIKYYEAAQRLHADDGEFNDIHVNALAELYLIEKMYPKVDQLISATRARADPEVEFPMDLVVKQGIAQIHMGRFDMAEVGRWARGTCAPIQVTKRSPYPRAFPPWAPGQKTLETLLASQPERFADLFVEVSAAYMEREHYASAVPWLRAAIESPEVRGAPTGSEAQSVALTRVVGTAWVCARGTAGGGASVQHCAVLVPPGRMLRQAGPARPGDRNLRIM